MIQVVEEGVVDFSVLRHLFPVEGRIEERVRRQPLRAAGFERVTHRVAVTARQPATAEYHWSSKSGDSMRRP